MVVFGTRPEAIKLAPVIRALKARGDRVKLTLCATAQHRELLDSTCAAIDLQPDIDLDLMCPQQHPNLLLGRLLAQLTPILQEIEPETIVVQGDTTSVIGAAMAAFGCGAKVAHVEAGLRTNHRRRPYPEEMNRRMVSVIADIHFAPTPGARQALLESGVEPQQVYVTGNTGIDALFWMRDQMHNEPLPPGVPCNGHRLVVVTAHRRESFGAALVNICHALHDIVSQCHDVQLVYPVHLNPNVRRPVRQILGDTERVAIIEPLNYREFVNVMSKAHLIITDSGGVQEEAPAMGVPVIVAREQCDRPESLAAGVAKLVGTDRKAIVREAMRLLTDDAAYESMARPQMVYGDGKAAGRIAEVLVDDHMTTPAFVPSVAAHAG